MSTVQFFIYHREKERENLLRELLGSVGNNPQLKPGFLCDTGSNIHIGDNFITNYNVTILDMASVTIGNNVWLGPNVGIYAVAHPIDAIGRKINWELPNLLLSGIMFGLAEIQLY